MLLHHFLSIIEGPPTAPAAASLSDNMFGVAGNGGGSTSITPMVKSVDKGDVNAEVFGITENPWSPICSMCEWQNTKNRKCITVIINLNAGAAMRNSKEITVGVTPGGMELWIKTMYPEGMTNWGWAKLMYTDALKAHPDYIRRMIAHEDLIKKLVGTEGAKKYITSFIELPFRVIESTNLETELFGHKGDESRVLHIYLESFQEPTYEKPKVAETILQG